MSEFNHVIKRSGARVPFNKSRIVNAIYRAAVATGERDRKLAENLANMVVNKLQDHIKSDQDPHIEEIQDIVEKVLIENGHSRLAKAYILYREEAARRRREKNKKNSMPSENIPWAKIWHILDWAINHDLHSIDTLNRRIRNGEFPAIVNESESAYEDEISTAADMLLEHGDDLKMVFISGPSSSGKTTTTIKLEKRLTKKGLKFVPLNLDNYFFDLTMHPKDEFGDYDFETPQALDLDLINEHLRLLGNGEEVRIPKYNFRTGMRELDVTPMRLKENEILLIDSLHGLYPQMSRGIDEEIKFKIYLEPLLQMKNKESAFFRWTDLRMIRRMLRDAEYRAYKPEQTLLHWHYVRASEIRHIIPYINTADYIINTGMPYEIALYRARLFDQFEEWVKTFQDDPLREDAYLRAKRIYDFIQHVIPVYDESAIPGDSILREFIGGSVLMYH